MLNSTSYDIDMYNHVCIYVYEFFRADWQIPHSNYYTLITKQ